jgi:hypothetical protein
MQPAGGVVANGLDRIKVAALLFFKRQVLDLIHVSLHDLDADVFRSSPRNGKEGEDDLEACEGGLDFVTIRGVTH